jgi:Zn-dependent peptidase ImmA (M78 family)
MKNKLFEIFEKVNHISLDNDQDKRDEIIKQFITFADTELNLGGNIPKINISYNDDEAKKSKSFGGYVPNDMIIDIIGANRNLADILRTLGHELVHHKQNLEGKINAQSGETGSDEENEANAKAGILLRNFGKINDNIYE